MDWPIRSKKLALSLTGPAVQYPQIVEEPAPLPKPLPAPLVELISKMLNKNPRERPAAREVAQALESLVAEMYGPPQS